MGVIENPPVRDKVLDQNGTMSRPWRFWFQALTDVLNNTVTMDIVTQAVPEVLTEITYIDGAE